LANADIRYEFVASPSGKGHDRKVWSVRTDPKLGFDLANLEDQTVQDTAIGRAERSSVNPIGDNPTVSAKLDFAWPLHVDRE
jgi:hypothetical protein